MNDYAIVREYLNAWGERELPDYHEDEPEAALDRIEQREQRLRAALERLASPDEMGGMGTTEIMTGPAKVELDVRMKYAQRALKEQP